MGGVPSSFGSAARALFFAARSKKLDPAPQLGNDARSPTPESHQFAKDNLPVNIRWVVFCERNFTRIMIHLNRPQT